MEASKVERGTTLQGEYDLLECIGDRSGLVFRAQRRRDRADVIVRVFAGLDRALRERVIEHTRRAVRLRHPVLAAVSAAGSNGDDMFVVEEAVEGRSIAALTERSGIPPLARAVEIALQLCRGLESAHRLGVAHDALGPRNVLLRGAGEGGPLQVKLIDLGAPGYARPWPPALSRALYMAPEQLALARIGHDQQGATAAMNLYSVGALLYDLCTGGPPLPASSIDELLEAHAAQRLIAPSRINPQIPSTLDAVLLRALSPDPAQRFHSTGELIEALSALRLTTGVSGVQPVAVLPRASEPPPERERATWHGGFDERPTSKTERPPPELPPRSLAPRSSSRPPQLPPARSSSLPPQPPPVRSSSPPSLPVPSSSSPSSPPPVRRSTPPRGAFSAVTPAPFAAGSDARSRRVRFGWIAAGSCFLVLFAYALSLPLPQERVRTTALAAVPEPAAPHAPRVRQPRADDAEPAPPVETEVSAIAGGETHARTPQRVLRTSDARTRNTPRARVVESEHASVPAPAPSASEDPLAVLDALDEAQTAVPADRSHEPAPVQAPAPARTPAPAPARTPAPASAPLPAPAPAPARTLRARIVGLSVRGSLPSSQVAHGVERVLPQLNQCYHKAKVAGGTQAAPRLLHVTVELDEQGRARNPSVSGAALPGLSACVSAVVSRIASRRAPDTGTVVAAFALELAP
jgi:serine/threonine protein kinase